MCNLQDANVYNVLEEVLAPLRARNIVVHEFSSSGFGDRPPKAVRPPPTLLSGPQTPVEGLIRTKSTCKYYCASSFLEQLTVSVPCCREQPATSGTRHVGRSSMVGHGSMSDHTRALAVYRMPGSVSAGCALAHDLIAGTM